MITFRSDRAIRLLGTALATAGLIGGAVSLGIEFVGSDWLAEPSSARTHEIVSHGAHFWVSRPVWWIHRMGLWAFFAVLALAVFYQLGLLAYSFRKQRNKWLGNPRKKHDNLPL